MLFYETGGRFFVRHPVLIKYKVTKKPVKTTFVLDTKLQLNPVITTSVSTAPPV